MLAELSWDVELLGPRPLGRMIPQRIARVTCDQDQRVQGAASLGSQVQTVEAVDDRGQKIQGTRQVMFDRFFRIDPVIILQRSDSFEGARTMQRICRGDLLALSISCGSQRVPRIFAMRTGVHTRIGSIRTFAPEERIGMNFCSAFFTGCEIQRLQMRRRVAPRPFSRQPGRPARL